MHLEELESVEDYTYNKAEYETAVSYLTAYNRFYKGDRQRAVNAVNHCIRYLISNPKGYYCTTGGAVALTFGNHIQIFVNPSVAVEVDKKSYRKVKNDFSFEEDKVLKSELEECFVEADKLFNRLSMLFNKELKKCVDEHHLEALTYVRDKGTFEVPSFIQSIAAATSLAGETMAQVDSLRYKLELEKENSKQEEEEEENQ